MERISIVHENLHENPESIDREKSGRAEDLSQDSNGQQTAVCDRSFQSHGQQTAVCDRRILCISCMIARVHSQPAGELSGSSAGGFSCA